jgi:hypothetical protein
VPHERLAASEIVDNRIEGTMGESAPTEGESPVIVSLADAAMHMYVAAIDSLPFPDDKKFHKRADVILSGMRKLRAALAEAAAVSRSTPKVIVALSEVRRRYDDLMAHAAAAPGSSLGQRLYAARIAAKLSAQEVANGAGLSADLLDELEAGETPTEWEAEKVMELIAAFGWQDASPNGEQPQSYDAESHLNGWDESLVDTNHG